MRMTVNGMLFVATKYRCFYHEKIDILGTLHQVRLPNGKLRLPLINTNQERVQVTRFFILYTYSKSNGDKC